MKYSYTYLVSMQFLGFRFHGWQKQTNAKTLHDMVDKSLSFVFNHFNYKTLGVGRTDAKVSANHYIFQLFINESIDGTDFISKLNSNIPPDFKALHVKSVATNFNIIQHPKIKEYLYFFSFGEKNHPFAAPLIVGFDDNLDIEMMKKGAVLFQGEHYFQKYCTQPSEKTIFKRTIDCCEITENTIYTANFFPRKSYYLRVKGSGFLRYQIRLMMYMLFELGKGKVSLEQIKQSIQEDNDRKPLQGVAPASGLQLYSVELKKL
ncbi:MAG TPA: tRNA pseudouridine(38-40) synthase TruA [Flavobacteriaceae bacterium]|nr:tRNA pseudouridine(38-40) synthase TruA [Flavobacteriaceae bacterium]HBS12898.1 tRNA pseudouridine(38-40) synthase TruA [Flavobacteriaceae bacterium]